MYKLENKEGSLVSNLEKNVCGIHEGHRFWEDYQAWLDDGNIPEAYEESYADKVKQAEYATFSFVQAEIDNYNKSNGLCFANVYTCKAYADEENYTHASFCKAVFTWNTAVWERAREIQEEIQNGTLAPPETVEEYLALLPPFGG